LAGKKARDTGDRRPRLWTRTAVVQLGRRNPRELFHLAGSGASRARAFHGTSRASLRPGLQWTWTAGGPRRGFDEAPKRPPERGAKCGLAALLRDSRYRSVGSASPVGVNRLRQTAAATCLTKGSALHLPRPTAPDEDILDHERASVARPRTLLGPSPPVGQRSI